MKAFLYLYPIEDFFNWEVKNRSWYMGPENLEKYKNKVRSINEFINNYRLKDYRIAYACFSDGKGCIDEGILSDFFKFQETDLLINCGVTFNDHIKQQVYPSEELIINSLMPLDELVVAGFHMHDCCKRVNEKAVELGVNSIVDRALTQAFFYLIKEGNDVYDELRKFDEKAKFLLKDLQ